MSFQNILDFFNHPIFAIVGGITFIFGIFAFLTRATLIILGISPIVFRVGKAIWKRKIGIIANLEVFNDLKSCLADSGLFKDDNIVQIQPTNLEKAKEYTILLVDWESAGAQIEHIQIARKSHQTALIIFAKPGTIPQEVMTVVANKSNTVVVNFKGRLLNDLLNSLITTNFQ
jgi:hypothetical protein